MARTPADPDEAPAEFVRKARTPRAPSSEPGRHLARRTAMQVLYRSDLTDLSSDELVAQFEAEHDFALPDYARTLVAHVGERREQIDALITTHLRDDWQLSRLGAVERAILRIGACELLVGETPVAVVIDEAVELGKRYATPEAARLINGVLGSWARDNTPDTGASRP